MKVFTGSEPVTGSAAPQALGFLRGRAGEALPPAWAFAVHPATVSGTRRLVAITTRPWLEARHVA